MSTSEDIKKRSLTFGIALGLLCLPFAFFGGILGACCPLGSFIGVAPVVFSAFWGGLLAAMFLEWGAISHEEAMGVGVRVGMRTGLIASIIGATITVVVASFLVSGMGAAMESAAASDPALQGGAGATLAGGGIASNLIVGIVSLIPGTLFGIVGGVFGAAIKRK